MDISVALCIIAKVKVVYTSTDCSVLLPGKSHSQHDNHFWSERESAKLQYNIYNNWRTEWGANITKHAATIKIRLQCTLISQKLAKVQMFLACKKYCSIMVCTWTFLSRQMFLHLHILFLNAERRAKQNFLRLSVTLPMPWSFMRRELSWRLKDYQPISAYFRSISSLSVLDSPTFSRYINTAPLVRYRNFIFKFTTTTANVGVLKVTGRFLNGLMEEMELVFQVYMYIT